MSVSCESDTPRFAQWGAVAAVSLAALSAHSRADTFTDALVSAYNTNPQLLSERAQLRVTDEKVPQALVNMRPTLSISGGGGYVRDQLSPATQLFPSSQVTQISHRSYDLALTEPLYRGGRTRAQLRQALYSVQSGTAHLLVVEENVLLQAISDYVEIAQQEHACELGRQKLRAMQIHLQSANEQMIAGSASRVDLAQAQASYSEAVAALHESEQKLQAAQLSFVTDVGFEPGPVEFPSREFESPATLEEAVQISLAENPAILAAQSAELEALEGVELTAGQGRPTVSLQAGLHYQDGVNTSAQHDRIESVTLQVTVPLYTGGSVSSQVRAARETLNVREAQVQVERNKAMAQVRTEWEAVRRGRMAIEAYDAQIRANEIAVHGVELQQRGGTRTILDVLNAEQALYESRMSLAQARHDLTVAKFSLLSALGRLTAKALVLPVNLYDPDRNLQAVKHKWW